MPKQFHSSWAFIKKTFINFLEHDSFSHASSIAFSTIFSLPAVLIIALSMASLFYEKQTVQDELLQQFEGLIGNGSAKEIEQIIQNSTGDTNSIAAGIIGLAILLFSATTVFIALQSSLNNLWGIRPKPQKNWVKFIVNRLLSFALVMSFGFVLLVSLLIDALLVIFQNFISQILHGTMTSLITGINLIISLLTITFIFALLFKLLPDAKIRWRDLWVGSIITALLFTAGKYVIGLYLGNSGFHSVYGAAGSFVVILIWVYYSTIIFLFGAELTFEYANEFGRPIEPYEHAVRFKIVELPITSKSDINKSLKKITMENQYSVQEAIDMCRRCEEECLSNGQKCREEELHDCARLCMECATACRKAADDGSIDNLLFQLCGDACVACAAVCKQHHHQHCMDCAKMCSECAAVCYGVVTNEVS